MQIRNFIVRIAAKKHKRAFVFGLIVFCGLFLSACFSAKEGNYAAEGVYVRSESGRSYLYEAENQDQPILLMYASLTEENLFADLETGTLISVHTGPYRKNELSFYGEVFSVSVKKRQKPVETLDEIIQAVHEVDEAYNKCTATGIYAVSTEGNRYFIDEENGNQVIRLITGATDRLFENLETGDQITIGPINLLWDEISCYAIPDVCEKSSTEKSEIPVIYTEKMKEIDGLLMAKK